MTAPSMPGALGLLAAAVAGAAAAGAAPLGAAAIAVSAAGIAVQAGRRLYHRYRGGPARPHASGRPDPTGRTPRALPE